MPKSSPSDTSLSGSTPASSVPREGSSEFGHSSASSANFDSLSPSIQTQAAPKKHIACRNCRSSKVKCRGDGMGPCPACIRLGEVCLYIPRRPRARRTAAVPGLGVPATETPTAPAKMLMPSPSRGLSAGVGGGDWDYLMRQHWLLPRFGHPTSLHGMVHNVATPGASFVGAALRVLPAFRAVLEAGLMPDASGSQRNLARSIRSMLEVELPRFLDYSSRKGNGTTSPTTSSSTDSEDDVMTNNNRGRNRNSGSSDLALLFSFGALLRFFTATGHVEFGRKVLDASHSVIRRTATRLSKPGAVDRVGGPAAYQVWLRAVWVMVQAEMLVFDGQAAFAKPGFCYQILALLRQDTSGIDQRKQGNFCRLTRRQPTAPSRPLPPPSSALTLGILRRLLTTNYSTSFDQFGNYPGLAFWTNHRYPACRFTFAVWNAAATRGGPAVDRFNVLSGGHLHIEPH